MQDLGSLCWRIRNIVAIVCLCGTGIALAQPFPTAPVKIVVPFAAGGGGDIVVRLVASRLSDMWTQPVVVENRPGGNTIVGTNVVAKAKPDGYTLLMVAISHTVNFSLYPKLPYRESDFDPVTQLVRYGFVLTAHPSLDAKNVPDLISLARAKAGRLSYAAVGTGSMPQLVMELFKNMGGGLDIVAVNYQGAAPATNAVIGGEVELFFNNSFTAMPMIGAGRLRALAVTTAARSPLLPDVPTVAESGLAGFDATGWLGILAPAGTPPGIVAKLQKDIAAALGSKEVSAKLNAEGMEPVGSSIGEFGDFLKSETMKWSKVVKEAQLKLE
ncbi:MAG: tripartite tricarboxylate transporter substrate binding protein [Lautropia sp.]